MTRSTSFFQLVSLWIRSRILRERAARWNYQYSIGRWEKLKIPQEQERFAATALMLVRHVPPGRILEIGCGEALLQQRLIPADYTSWTGVDISEVAIGRAQAFAGERVRFLAADMDTFAPDGRFDGIVFTESIYYSADCAGLLRRYSRYLRPDGVFVISIMRTRRNLRVWAALHAVTAVLDTVSTTNELGTWDCEVLAACG